MNYVTCVCDCVSGRKRLKMDFSFFRDKKVLITGHTGFKGSWMCKLLIMAGAKVTGYALESPTDPSAELQMG